MDPELERLVAEARSQGASDSEVAGYLRSKGYSPPTGWGLRADTRSGFRRFLEENLPSPRSAGRMFAQGASQNLGDELVGMAGGDIEADRQRMKDTREMYPASSLALELGGNVAATLAGGKLLGMAASAIPKIAPLVNGPISTARGLLTGATIGGVNAAGAADPSPSASAGDNFKQRAYAGTLGGLLGVAMGAIGGAVAPTREAAQSTVDAARTAGMLRPAGGGPAPTPKIPLTTGELLDSPGLAAMERGAGAVPSIARQSEAIQGRVNAIATGGGATPRSAADLGRVAAQGGVLPETAEGLAGTARGVGGSATPSLVEAATERQVWVPYNAARKELDAAVAAADPRGQGVSIAAIRDAIPALDEALTKAQTLSLDPADANKLGALQEVLGYLRAPQPGFPKGRVSFGQLMEFRKATAAFAKYDKPGAKTAWQVAVGNISRAADDAAQAAVDAAGPTARAPFNRTNAIIREFNNDANPLNQRARQTFAKSDPIAAFRSVTGETGEDLAKIRAFKGALGDGYDEFARRELMDLGTTGDTFSPAQLVKRLGEMGKETRLEKFGTTVPELEALLDVLRRGGPRAAGKPGLLQSGSIASVLSSLIGAGGRSSTATNITLARALLGSKPAVRRTVGLLGGATTAHFGRRVGEE